MATPEEKATPEWQAKRAAREAFKAARAQWRDATTRIGEIKAKIDAGGLTDAEEGALKDELKGLKATRPTLGETMRSTKATWEGFKGNRDSGRDTGDSG